MRPPTSSTTDPVPLNDAGNFKIRGSLTGRDASGNIVPFPPACANPKTADSRFRTGGWFAAESWDSDAED